jgi:hypothetical protein
MSPPMRKRYLELLAKYHDIIGQEKWDHEALKPIAEKVRKK